MNHKILVLSTLALGLVDVLVGIAVPARVAAAPAPTPAAPAVAWAWCGVHPDDPAAIRSARAMADVAGIDATFGPCNVPTPDYTPAFTANRYVAPEVYRRLVDVNAAAGMQTVVYDARVWSDDPAVRDAAVAFWAPVREHIAAWDLGDEFDPDGPEWEILVHRWGVVRGDVAARTGIAPFTNHLWWATDEALADLPGSDQLLSFTLYGSDLGASVAAAHDAGVAELMCGVNAFDHFGYTPTDSSIRAAMAALGDAGCDRFLVFGGHPVYDSASFGEMSLVDRDGVAGTWAAAVQEGAGHSGLVPVTPARLYETRTGPGLGTVDGIDAGAGRRPAGSVTAVQVAGRAGVAAGARAAVLEVTVTGSQAGGFVTVFPCDAPRPNAAQVNHAAGATLSTAVVAALDASGAVCLYTMSDTELVVDVDGWYPAGTSYAPLVPARLLETRTGPGLATVDGRFDGIGLRSGGSVTELDVAGRGGVPPTTGAAVLTVTVTAARAPGFVTVFPCDGPIPTASNLNYVAGSTVTNTVVADVSPRGTVCLYTMADVDMVVDVGGHHPTGSNLLSLHPSRLMDTRSGGGSATIDGLHVGVGPRFADSVTELTVAGRGGVPADARAVVLNVTVTEARGDGFVTVHPCGTPRPNAAHVNVGAGATVSNLVVVEVGADGAVCLYAMAGMHLVVDVTGVHP